MFELGNISLVLINDLEGLVHNYDNDDDLGSD